MGKDGREAGRLGSEKAGSKEQRARGKDR